MPDLVSLLLLDKNAGAEILVGLMGQGLSRRSDHPCEPQMYRNMLCYPIYGLSAEPLFMMFICLGRAENLRDTSLAEVMGIA